MNKYIFSSQTHWAKILASVAFLIGCGGQAQEQPQQCPARLEEMTLMCSDDFDSKCRYDVTGEASVDSYDSVYQCKLVHCASPGCSYWIAVESKDNYIDPGSRIEPVDE